MANRDGGSSRDSAWARLMRFLGNEIRIAETPGPAPDAAFTFLGFFTGDGSMQVFSLYKVGIPQVNDPNNRGYKLYYTLNGNGTEQEVKDGDTIKFPAQEADFVGFLAPIGPDGQVRGDKAGPPVSFKVRAFNPPPPPPDAEVQTAPTPTIEFVGFQDEDGNPVG